MDMKIMKSERKLCPCCMEYHDVKTVLVKDQSNFKNGLVEYEASYLFCDLADELYMDEQQIQENDLKLKDAYREKEGLLTSEQISGIRGKYGISQHDMCMLLGWGGKTITRYESHQVQDKAHDTILRKIDQDPEWFIVLLNEAKANFSVTTYKRYLKVANALYECNRDLYLRKAIEANYARFQGNQKLQGNTELSLNRTVDLIRYFASSPQVTNLYKVKLMKMLWYADALSYKKRGMAITGLVYQALPMGAVPVGHNAILDLKDVPCEEIEMGENIAYHFILKGNQEYHFLTETDRDVLEYVIAKLGKMNTNEIVTFMHNEQAYQKTALRDYIEFQYAEFLQI